MSDRLNILGKQGYLTDEERKQPFEHGCEYFTFKTCLDLSKPINYDKIISIIDKI